MAVGGDFQDLILLGERGNIKHAVTWARIIPRGKNAV
jgi:hypothetical protein